MPKFTVLVRAMRMLTAEITVEADNEHGARSYAESCIAMPNFGWDESEPEDRQIETIIPED